MKKDLFEKIFFNPYVVLFFLSIFLILIISNSFGIGLFAERSSVTGIFVEAHHRGYGDFCGQYPFTSIVLSDYFVDGDMDDSDNRFYFGNQYEDVDNLVVGQRYKFNCHKESRSSNTTSGNQIEYWVLDSIENPN